MYTKYIFIKIPYKNLLLVVYKKKLTNIYFYCIHFLPYFGCANFFYFIFFHTLIVATEKTLKK